jgi:hypothetical protein
MQVTVLLACQAWIQLHFTTLSLALHFVLSAFVELLVIASVSCLDCESPKSVTIWGLATAAVELRLCDGRFDVLL